MPQIESRFFFVDVETTGTNPAIHDPLSVALVPIDDSQPSLLVHIRTADTTWTDFGRSNFHSFEDQWMEYAVCPKEALALITAYLDKLLRGSIATIVGHNVGFDLSFLRKLAALAGQDDIRGISHRTIDTHTLLYALRLQDRIPESALTSDGAFAHFGINIPRSERHTALGDAIATRSLFLKIVGSMSEESADQSMLPRTRTHQMVNLKKQSV